MNTVLRGSRTSFSLFIIGILVCAPVTQIHAQNGTSSVEAETTSVNTEVAPVVAPYKTEKLTGNSIQSGDYVVGPGKVEMVVRPGQSVTKIITVTNRISNGRQFELMVEDMSGSADGSQNVVLLGDLDGPYSLRDFISVPHETFMLGLGERAQIPVTVTMPPNAEPGGYYGAVLVSTVKVDDSEEDTGAPRSPIVARIGSLFFITVPGDINVGGEIKDVSTINNRIWYDKGPIDLGVLFENTGSVHLNPHGTVRVRNMFGEEVGYVELEPWFVLPKSLRLREVTWDRELLFGRYSFEVEVHLGYEDKVDTRTIAVWVLPWKVLLGTFLIIVFILWIIRFFFRTFEFKRRDN